MSSTFVMPWTVDVDEVASSDVDDVASSQAASSQAVANVNAEEDDSDDSGRSIGIGIEIDEEMAARIRNILNAD